MPRTNLKKNKRHKILLRSKMSFRPGVVYIQTQGKANKKFRNFHIYRKAYSIILLIFATNTILTLKTIFYFGSSQACMHRFQNQTFVVYMLMFFLIRFTYTYVGLYTNVITKHVHCIVIFSVNSP